MGTHKVKKVFIDTNVLVSNFFFGGVPGELIRSWKKAVINLWPPLI